MTTDPSIQGMMSMQEFMSFGADHIAYIRSLHLDGSDVYGVFSADGRMIGTMSNRQAAFTVARENELWPVSVH